MRKLFLFFSLILLFVSCSKSNQEKAEDLIKKELNKVIVNFDSYEPIETKVDSAFAPIHTVETCKYLEGVYDKMTLLLELAKEVEVAKDMMDSYAGSFYSSKYYNKYKKEYESKNLLLDSLTSKFEEEVNKISNNQSEGPVFNGYMATHQYRYTTKDGKKTIGRGFFLFNKEIDKVEYYIDLEDEKIKQVLELTDLGNSSILKNQ